MQIATMVCVGDKREEVATPQLWRDSVASHLEAWILEQGLVKGKTRSERVLAPRLGISSFSLNRLRLRKGPMGLHNLVKIRHALGISLDELLGLEPNTETVRRIVREELAAHDATARAAKAAR